MIQESRTECEDKVDSQTESSVPGGLSKDHQHIILPQVQNLQGITEAKTVIRETPSLAALINESELEGVVCFFSFVFFQDHVGLGLCLEQEESKEGVVVRSLVQQGTACKVWHLQ